MEIALCIRQIKSFLMISKKIIEIIRESESKEKAIDKITALYLNK